MPAFSSTIAASWPPMSIHLPSSTALITFERLFRVRSINKVAEQLHMTPPAVSYQINMLETRLGQKLFLRSRKGVEPTPFAESIYFDVTVALEHLRSVMHRSRDQQRSSPIRILATQALASLWLLPKMPDLLEHFPGIHFEIISWKGGFDHQETERGRQDFDFEFRYARHDELSRPDLARLISSDMAIPVCSPDYFNCLGAPESPHAWRSATILHARNWPGIWERWCEAAFQQIIQVDHALHFQGTSLCVQAALGGVGIAIVHAPLVAGEISAKRLVCPHPLSLPVEEAYFAVLGDAHTRHADLFDGFVAWCRKHMSLRKPIAVAKNEFPNQR